MKKDPRRSVGLIFLITILFASYTTFFSCDKLKDDDDRSNDAPTDTTDTTDDGVVDDGSTGTLAIEAPTENALAAAYPVGLATSAFSQEVDSDVAATAGTLAIDYDTSLHQSNLIDPCATRPENKTEGGVFNDFPAFKTWAVANLSGFEPPSDHEAFKDKPPSKKASDAISRLNGDSECYTEEITEAIARLTSFSNNGLPKLGCYQFDWGILNKNYHSTEEACLVGVSREQIAEGTSYIDFTTLMVQTMLCQAKKDGKSDELDVDETRDLKTSLATAMATDPGVTIIGANVKKIKADRVIYKSFIKMNVGKFEYAFELVNSPDDESDPFNGYEGSLWLKHGLYNGEIKKKHKFVSMAYRRDTSSSGLAHLKFELRSGAFALAVKPITRSGMLDLNTGADFSFPPADPRFGSMPGTHNQHLDSITLTQYDGFPEVNIGRLSFWVNPGNQYTENARGYIFDTKLHEGIVKGCAVAGAIGATGMESVSIRKSLYDKTPITVNGFLRPFHVQMCGPEIWKQCFKQNADGIFVIDGADGTSRVPAAQRIAPPNIDKARDHKVVLIQTKPRAPINDT